METKMTLAIALMAAVTFIPRLLPVISLSRMKLPEYVIRWLEFVPVAALSALVAPIILVSDGKLDLSLGNSYLIAAIPCIIIAAKTRSMALTVLFGMGLIALMRFLGYA